MHPETTTPVTTTTTPAHEPVHAPYVPGTQVAKKDDTVHAAAVTTAATATPVANVTPPFVPFNHQHAFPFVRPNVPAQTSVGHVDGYGAVNVQHTTVAGVTPAAHAAATPATTTSSTPATSTYDGKTITIDGRKYQLKLAE